ncbi:hypothetical protein [Flavobacterium collinsii]|uniref:Uncharacterized protein n=1 Tax=Flavobacterium collinsii TaxID=1114861 RepID=A0ABN7ES01_9FLAO|nr:hypothetical protein [Flavobacterium collinsii]CAA9203366.1 hypothetical protein FLACOL7796_04708 [Flavobacterium collinsii]
MEKIIEKLVIKLIMESEPFTFRDVNFENCAEELKPLIIALLKNYFYLKKQNPENKPCVNSFFIQGSKKK